MIEPRTNLALLMEYLRADTATISEAHMDDRIFLATTPEQPTRFRTIYDRCVREAEASGAEPFSLWPLTDEVYRFWKANAGNAKARRRWRRRDIPNSQRSVVP